MVHLSVIPALGKQRQTFSGFGFPFGVMKTSSNQTEVIVVLNVNILNATESYKVANG